MRRRKAVRWARSSATPTSLLTPAGKAPPSFAPPAICSSHPTIKVRIPVLLPHYHRVGMNTVAPPKWTLGVAAIEEEAAFHRWGEFPPCSIAPAPVPQYLCIMPHTPMLLALRECIFSGFCVCIGFYENSNLHTRAIFVRRQQQKMKASYPGGKECNRRLSRNHCGRKDVKQIAGALLIGVGQVDISSAQSRLQLIGIFREAGDFGCPLWPIDCPVLHTSRIGL